jgi:hypothetical protein
MEKLYKFICNLYEQFTTLISVLDIQFIIYILQVIVNNLWILPNLIGAVINLNAEDLILFQCLKILILFCLFMSNSPITSILCYVIF